MIRTRRKLTAVMFTDVVGYSAMVHADEAAAHELLAMHRALLRRCAGQYRGAIVEETGDGTLITFDSALAAVECAVAIQDALRRRNAESGGTPLKLRIGLHQGDIEHGQGTVYGDGVNVCARLEPLAPHGGIAASAAVIGQVHGPLRAHFHDAGARALKNIPEPVTVFELGEGGLAAAVKELTTQRAPLLGRRAGAMLAVAALLALLAGTGLLWQSRVPVDAASIAILPLENLSTDAGGAEFVAGLHDSLLTEVSKAPGLRVISRSSVMRYASQRPAAGEIGRALNVAHVLEGSVQTLGTRVRVNVQLIRTATDEHVWAQIFDRDRADLFALQTDISREIARKIQGNLALGALPKAQRPTRSVEAYDLYLRAIAHEDGDVTLGFAAPDDPLRLLAQAVAFDPDFALAHAALARFELWGARWASYTEPAKVAGHVARATAAAQRAMALAPDSAESLLAMGMAKYWSDGDAVAARGYFQQALQRRPGFPLALYLLSGIYDRGGELDQSVEAARTLLDVDPANDKAHEQLTALLVRQRRYAEADDAYARWLEQTSRRPYVAYLRAQLQFFRSGDVGPWQRLVEQPVDSDGGLTQDSVDYDRCLLDAYAGRYAECAARSRAAADAFVEHRSEDFRAAFTVGEMLELQGRHDEARHYLEALRENLQDLVTRAAADRTSLLALALSQAWLGEREAALSSGQQALALATPRAGAKPSGSYYDTMAGSAQVGARLGLVDETLRQLELLLAQPSGVHAHAVLRDPMWAPVSGDPRFVELVRRYLPAR